jgi:peptide/nickel transport system substrate-binding protein
LTVNQTGPLADQRVRRALVSGLDRALIGQADLPGLAWEAALLDNLVWQPGQPAYADVITAAGLGYDLEASQALLDAAGWTLDEAGDETGWRVKAGRRLELVFLVDQSDPLSESEGLQVAAQLRELGIAVTLSLSDSYEADRAAGDFDLASEQWLNTLRPALSLGARFAATGDNNTTGYSNPAVEAQLNLAAQNGDSAARTRLLTAAATTLGTDVAAIPLYVIPETWVARTALANFGPSGLATLRWQDVGFVS